MGTLGHPGAGANLAGPLTLITTDPSCPASACAHNPAWGDATAWVYESPSSIFPRWTLYHELGHEFDARYLTNGDRAMFTGLLSRLLGVSPGPWIEDILTTSGVVRGFKNAFADEYAFCALGDRRDAFPAFCHAVARIGAREGAAPPYIDIGLTQHIARALERVHLRIRRQVLLIAPLGADLVGTRRDEVLSDADDRADR